MRIGFARVVMVGAFALGLCCGGLAHADEGEAPLTRVRDVLLVSAEINGVGPYPFVLDPAVHSVVLGVDVAAYLGLDAPGGASGASTAAVDSFRVGGLLLSAAPVLVMDLSGFEARLGERVAGIMPAWFPGCEVTLDFEAGRIVVREVSTLQSESEPPGSLAPAPVDTEALTVRGLVNGRHLRSFVVDPTFGGVMAMPEADLRELGALRDDTRQLVVAENASREGKAVSPALSAEPVGRRQIRLNSLRVEGMEILEPACVVLESGAHARVGLGLLQHFQVSFRATAEEHTLGLERVSATPWRDAPVVGYGISPGEFQDGWWHVFVAEGSPAARAGVVNGDRLVAVDGEPMLDLAHDELIEQLAAAPGDEVELDIGHGEQIRTVRLTAEPLL